jgi:hypothetical protein
MTKTSSASEKQRTKPETCMVPPLAQSILGFFITALVVDGDTKI